MKIFIFINTIKKHNLNSRDQDLETIKKSKLLMKWMKNICFIDQLLWTNRLNPLHLIL